ncbi:hypothetical protein CSKR_103145 [Clonorchis sinensis]|uniref:Uncharacterized protein n=1 Tax=Clonorchis sinensis TaxID=79923 RepID=A0A3R7FX12_CLOSI|nr:hypothetical protein CSKR_103145 [Clonorchis sinensis]
MPVALTYGPVTVTCTVRSKVVGHYSDVVSVTRLQLVLENRSSRFNPPNRLDHCGLPNHHLFFWDHPPHLAFTHPSSSRENTKKFRPSSILCRSLAVQSHRTTSARDLIRTSLPSPVHMHTPAQACTCLLLTSPSANHRHSRPPCSGRRRTQALASFPLCTHAQHQTNHD